MSGEEHVHYVPEPSSVSMTFVGWSAFGAIVLLVLAIGGLHVIYNASVSNRTMPAPAAFPQPRVDTDDAAKLHQILGAQTKKLQSWGWADDQHTLVQVPIERAMRMMAKKGEGGYDALMPAQPALSAPGSAAQRAVTPGETSQDAAPAGNPARPGASKP